MKDAKKYLIDNYLERETENQYLLDYRDGKRHYITDIMQSFANIQKWISVEDELPDDGIEVIGFSEKWIHPDFNPEGTRVCFMSNGEWISAKWNNDQDSWHTHAEWCCGDNGGKDFNPTHWQHKPKKP